MTKGKTDKSDFNKINNFCTVKYIIKQMKRQPTGWEKILKITFLIGDLYPVFTKTT